MFAKREPEPTPEPPLAPEVLEIQELQAKGQPVSLCGSKAARRARFGPPIDPKTLPPRLISLGAQAIQMHGSGRSSKPRIQMFEAFVELGNVGDTYLREPHSTVLHPQINRSGGGDEVLERFEVPMSQLHPASDNHPAGAADQVVPFPEVTPEEAALARALFNKPAAGPGQTVTPAIDKPAW
jgi:hypothetical protein